MLDRPHLRIRVLADGGIVFTDPDPDTLPLIRAFDPSFTVRTSPLPRFAAPRLLNTRTTATGVAPEALSELTDDQLRAAHDCAMSNGGGLIGNGASLLDVKIELAKRMLQRCELCALRCRVNRLTGERGRCGLGSDASVYEAYVHIAEEPPINPALNISLRGCAMRCVFCQQAAALDPRGGADDVLTPAFWNQLKLAGARSLVFVGGNPTESLPAVLTFLRAAPADFALPVGWNCSGYDSPEAIALLDGVVDVYIPDFKYAGDNCATTLSDAPGYSTNVVRVLEAMLKQGVPVFVRVVVLPEHVECCHVPALESIAGMSSIGETYVSIQDTYLPEWRALSPRSPLSRRPTAEEVRRVRSRARELNLNLVE